jgi:NTP pyrophosphatase (non-canonical NTP hydrolase)
MTRNLLPQVRPELPDTECELPSLQEVELLTLVAEEAAEVQQAICKIIRHGWHSSNPLVPNSLSNVQHLQKEIGQLRFAIDLLIQGVKVLHAPHIDECYQRKATTIKRWLHFNRDIV